MSAWKAIAAVAENEVIGRGLEIPWRISDDFKHFKRTTLGGVIVMGRRTFESLGSKPLPERENVVISSGEIDTSSGVKHFKSLEDFANAYENDERQIWICGGATLYKSALKKCDEIVLSRVKLKPEGDVFFPDISSDFKIGETIIEHQLFDVIRYVRK